MKKTAFLYLVGAVLFCATDALAQEVLPIIHVEPGTPLVRDPEILVPEHDSEREIVLYRVYDFRLDAADIPFFIDRVGIAVPRETAHAAIEAFLREERTAVYSCSFEAGERPYIAHPSERDRFCVLQRQP